MFVVEGEESVCVVRMDMDGVRFLGMDVEERV